MPGAGATVGVMKLAAGLLTRSITYDVPPQDLRVDMRRIPTLPASNMRIRNVRRTE
jgi:fatty-acid peroxygenase